MSPSDCMGGSAPDQVTVLVQGVEKQLRSLLGPADYHIQTFEYQHFLHRTPSSDHHSPSDQPCHHDTGPGSQQAQGYTEQHIAKGDQDLPPFQQGKGLDAKGGEGSQATKQTDG